jgi:hypothetical protein
MTWAAGISRSHEVMQSRRRGLVAAVAVKPWLLERIHSGMVNLRKDTYATIENTESSAASPDRHYPPVAPLSVQSVRPPVKALSVTVIARKTKLLTP